MIIKSRKDSTELEITNIGYRHSDLYLKAEIRKSKFSGSVEASTYHVGCPIELFGKIADNWKGWDGEYFWCDLDSIISLTATSDKIGHVNLVVHMYDQEDELIVNLTLESEQLDKIYTEIKNEFS